MATPHEEAARRKKALRLVTAIDASLAKLQTDIVSEFAFQMVEAFGDREWAAVATTSGCNPPSEQTRDLVLDVYRERNASLKRLSDECGREIERAAAFFPAASREVADYEAAIYKQGRDARAARKLVRR